MKDGLVLFYVKNDIVYPIAMTQEQLDTLQFMGHLFELIKVINKPQGNAINLIGGDVNATDTK